MNQETLVKSRRKKLGTILTVTLLMVNFLSPVAALAQGTSDIQMEEGDFFHNPEDIVLPDLGKLDDLKTLEAERGHFDLSNIGVPNSANQMEVEVGTFVEFQRVIDEAVPDTALVIEITNSFEFDDVIVIEGGLDITLQSKGNYRLTQRNGRHFMVQSNSLFTLGEGVTLDGASQAGGIEVHNSTFIMEGGVIRSCTADFGAGVYVNNGIFNLIGGVIQDHSSSMSGSGVYVLNGEFNMYGGTIKDNFAADFGAGVYAMNGEFNMYGGNIGGNAARTAGGGMYLNGVTANMTGGRIYSNIAEFGGGVYLNGVTTNMVDVFIGYNGADFGGGMFLTESTANMTDVHFLENSSQIGGGMFLTESTANMTGGAIEYNAASNSGGGVYISDHAMLDLEDSVIEGNQAFFGGGVYIGPAGNLEMGGFNASIRLNWAIQGGGVVVVDLATFTMRDGSIRRNTATIDCAVMLYPSGTFNHEGGDVSC